MKRNLIYSLVFVFIISSFFSCSKEYSSESGAFTNAKGTLHDNSGSCYPSTIIGNYYTGVTLTDSNYVQLQVNVTTTGNYSIVSDTVNGFSFKDAGIFSTTGVQTITLKGLGQPVFNQNSDFLISFDSTVCTFTVLVQDSTGSTGGGGASYASDTAWHFSEGTKYFHGYIDTAFTFDTTVAAVAYKVLQIQGSTASAGDSIFLIGITFAGGVITPGAYPSNASSVFGFFKFNANNTLDSIYSAYFFIPTVNTTVNITAYNSTTKIIAGTFSGTARNKAGASVTISTGKFEAKLN